MSIDDIFADIEKYTTENAATDFWNELPPEKRIAFVKHAVYDVIAYATSVGVHISLGSEICNSAAAAQAIHIARQIFVEKNGLVITEENINGFGSRRYKLPDQSIISERSKMYIEAYAKSNMFVRTAR